MREKKGKVGRRETNKKTEFEITCCDTVCKGEFLTLFLKRGRIGYDESVTAPFYSLDCLRQHSKEGRQKTATAPFSSLDCLRQHSKAGRQKTAPFSSLDV